MYIIASQAEIQKLDWIPFDDWFEPLRSLDYSKHLAIVVFQGATPSTGYTTEIKRITIQNNIVYVEAEMRDPSYFIVVDGLAGIEAVDTMALPYKVVTIDKEGLPGKLTFVLAANTEFLEEIEVEINQSPLEFDMGFHVSTSSLHGPHLYRSSRPLRLCAASIFAFSV